MLFDLTLKRVKEGLKKMAFVYSFYKFLWPHVSPKKVFTEIYKTNSWDNTESVSGPGSTLKNTISIRNALLKILNDYEICSLLDIPCGDYNWMQYVSKKDLNYIGADIVKKIIDINNERYGQKNVQFKLMDLTKDSLPKTDLILCRDCLVHLPLSLIHSSINNICRSNSKYLLTTTFPEVKENIDISTGYWRPINLQEEPFNFPNPLLVVSEGIKSGQYQDKSIALWHIRSLPLSNG